MFKVMEISGRLKPYHWILLISALSLGGYLLASWLTYQIGFPLDDAWIHQTYARNLGKNGEWAFISGHPSAGSTAPLWTALLAVGHALGLGPYLWTYLLGWLALAGLALVGTWAFGVFCPPHVKLAVWAGLFLCLEWHLVWAAASGMETLFYALLVLLTLTVLVEGGENWLKLGLLVGLSVWVRPDGITLVGPVMLVILVTEHGWKRRLLATARFGLGLLLLLLPYLGFNYSLSSSWLPSTFFAKQAEYAVYRLLPLWQRLLAQASLPMIGVGVLLLPGFSYFIIQVLRHKDWARLASGAWLVGYILLYALRLPVTYQYGRYIMPAMPVYFVGSLVGMASWVQLQTPVLWRRVVSRVWLVSVALVLVSFWFIGARAYARDVAIIETEMVVTARWIAKNTDPQSLIAVHDIGALGYFADRRLLDLAGLVSPEVIPFLRDEARLAVFLDERGADYLVTFPSWYPSLSALNRLVFTTQGEFSPAAGGENMGVFLWLHP